MPRRILLSVFVAAVTAVTAHAADMPAQSRIGAIFAEPAEAHPTVYRSREDSRTVIPVMPYNLLPSPPWNHGIYNYGSSWSWGYGGAYYGGPYVSYAVRLPYVCSLYGLCAPY
jgi:hypothetical protein